MAATYKSRRQRAEREAREAMTAEVQTETTSENPPEVHPDKEQAIPKPRVGHLVPAGFVYVEAVIVENYVTRGPDGDTTNRSERRDRCLQIYHPRLDCHEKSDVVAEVKSAVEKYLKSLYKDQTMVQVTIESVCFPDDDNSVEAGDTRAILCIS